ncbi:MAG: peptide ABC transporter substrate-binding protein [Planctomycetota bacterium]|nr:peptide ABC transporter substrate-binding protein [Planctomycetota bacterium]
MKLRINSFLIGALAGSLILAPVDAEERDTIRIASGIPIRYVDPVYMTSLNEHRLALALYEGLTVHHPKTLKPIPGVAKRWELSTDARTYTFFLRENAHWVKDGKRLESVSAKDFQWAWFRLLRGDIQSSHSYLLHSIKGAKKFAIKSKNICAEIIKNAQFDDPKIEYFFQLPDDVRKRFIANELIRFGREVGVKALDNSKLQVTLKSAVPYFLDITSAYFMCPVYKKDLTGLIQYEAPFEKSIVTNGSFLMKKSNKTSFELNKNKHYWDAKTVSLKTIQVRFIEDPEKRLSAYLEGHFDWLPYLPHKKVRNLSRRDDFVSHPAMTTYFYRFNVKDPVFAGKRGLLLQKALSLSVNRQKIVDRVVQANQKPAFSIVPPGFYNYKNVDSKDATRHLSQVKQAKELLAKAGYPKGRGLKPLTILCNSGGPHQDIAKSIAEDWKKIGLEVTLEKVEWNNFLNRIEKSQYQIARSGWIGDFTDPATFLNLWVTNGTSNKTGWSNQRYDRLVNCSENIQEILNNPAQVATLLKDLPELKDKLQQFLAAKTLENMLKIREAILQEAEKLLIDRGPVIPIYYYTTNQLWSKKLRGLYGNIRNIHPPKFWSWKSRKAH